VVERGRAIFEQLRHGDAPALDREDDFVDGPRPVPSQVPSPLDFCQADVDGDAGPVAGAEPETLDESSADGRTTVTPEEAEAVTDRDPPADADALEPNVAAVDVQERSGEASERTGDGGDEATEDGRADAGVGEPGEPGAADGLGVGELATATPTLSPQAPTSSRSEPDEQRASPGPVPLGMPPEATSLLAGSDVTNADPSTYSPTRFARDLPRVMAIANQKGGVGKTTTAVNLGAGLAELGYRVLVIDLDPQGNATTGLGINPRNLESSIYDVMMHDVPLDDCIEPTSLRNLFVCPATIDLAGAEIELVPAFSRELKLRRALEPVLEDFDFVVIDCPPSLGLITVNALAAATEVVVPIQCEYYALEGLGQLLRNVKLVQTNLNPRLEVTAIVLTMFDARTKLADQVAGEVRSHFGPKVCRNIVPRTVRLSEAPSFGQPIVVFDPTSRGAIAYRELAKEVSGGAPQRVG